MYPSQTSLIPATVALVRFFEERGMSAFFQNYPYWYLGSTPYKYLTDPLMPLLVGGLHRIFSNVSLFDITIYLIIVSFWLVLRKKHLKYKLLALGFTLLALLINTSILPTLLIGVISLVLASSYREGRFKQVSAKLKLSLVLLAFSLVLVTSYYTPNYWLTILFDPSIGGVSLAKVIFRVFDLLKAGAPLVLAVAAVYFSGKIKSRLAEI